ncbi:MAG: ThiF family adenylyltransferase [Gammaproteobacteria bacterium]
MFSQNETLRYSRHFPVIGLEGQAALKEAKILCVGAGGLGSASLPYLAAAGIGTIGVMDGDDIELSNLQRQILFRESQIGQNKAKIACQNLSEINSTIKLNAYEDHLDEKNAEDIIQEYDLILDATDNFDARYLINRYSRLYGKPMVSSSIFQFDAQLSVFNYQDGPCYQCLYPERPPSDLIPNCALGGVLGVLPGVMGTLQANEVIKILLNKGEVLSGRLMAMDLLSMRMRFFEVDKNKTCSKYDCAPIKKSSEDIQKMIDIAEIQPEALKTLLSSEEIYLIDVREPFERQICHIGGRHIPLGQLENHYDDFPRDKKIIMYCKSGGRSRKAADLLQQAGFQNVFSLTGGILAWADVIDPSLHKY